MVMLKKKCNNMIILKTYKLDFYVVFYFTIIIIRVAD